MKIIAFYLPQFHEIPENNKWWGEGFTEWTNVKKAKPLFQDHYQPREPLNNNYYNLLNNNIKLWQIELAKKYGVYGFAFYHYWFKDGKKLLEKPVEQYLENENLDLPFCLSWANEPWSRRWDGSEHKVLMPQEYGGKKEWKKHFEYLLPFFKDDRYIYKEDKPLFIIYKPIIIPLLNEMLDYWQELAKQNNLNGIYFAYQHPSFHFFENKDDSRFDMAIEFEPLYSKYLKRNYKNVLEKLSDSLKRINDGPSGFSNEAKKIFNSVINKLFPDNVVLRLNATDIQSYEDLVDISINHSPLNKKSVPGVFPDWDNTPRRGKNSSLFVGSNPKKFENYLKKQIKRAKEVYNTNYIFINAWNEWGEGAYLEPDKKHRYSYLEAIKNSLTEYNEME